MGITESYECECGRTLPLIKRIEGRTVDSVITLDNVHIHGEFFSHIFWSIPNVKQFQVLQESLDEIIVKIIPDNNFNKSSFSQIERLIRHRIDDRTDIKIKKVDIIDSEKSGKRRFIISKLKPKI